MDAIPSLCATTASCGAAAIGYVYGRPASQTQELQGRNDGPLQDNGVVTSRLPLDTTPNTTPLRPLQHRRPQSASIPHTIPLWDRAEDGSAFSGAEDGTTGQQSGQSPAWTPASDVAEGKNLVRTSWARRMSTIAQSHDGSSLSSARPSSPSLFSNGSNAPFFPSNQVVTPRNRLVKRSTSHRVLHSASYYSSPIAGPQTPTFRRPATSHQRSEQLRLQNLQRELEHPSDPPQLDHVEIPPAELDQSKGKDSSEAAWQLYFESSPVPFFRETSLRVVSSSRPSNGLEPVRCVLPRTGFAPWLLNSSAIRKSPHQKPSTSTALPRLSHDPGYQSDSPDIHDQTHPKGPRARHSFSLGDIMSTPTPSNWKIRRGGSVKRPVQNEPVSSRRVVSAPQRNLLHSTPKAKPAVDPPAEEQTADRIKGPASAPNKRQPSRVTSSPLPPLKRISAFEIDLPAVSPAESPTQEHNLTESSHLPPSPGSSSDMHGPASLRIKPHRASRVPSDRASTVFSSDNEYSRVFSTDGDDFDRRSETVYDSIHTDATSSSHSGAKGHHAETVFLQQGSPDFSPRGLQALQDKLAHTNLTGSSLQDSPFSIEETGGASLAASNVSTESHHSSQRTFPLTSPNNTAATTPNARPRQGSTVAAQKDEFWSIEEEDSNWGDPESASHEDISHSIENAERPGLPDASCTYEMDQLSATGSPSRNSLQMYIERGGRTTGRRAPAGLHLRSQSVPLQPDNPNYRFNNVSKLESWMLGGKDASEDWDGDFVFDEPEQPSNRMEDQRPAHETEHEHVGVLVPPAILERQASVHGQFGQVKQLSQLVEELRTLHRKAYELGILHGQSAELWREAEGIIDLATLDEDEALHLPPHSPNSSNFDFEAFEDDTSNSNRTIKEPTPPEEGSSSTAAAHVNSDAAQPQQLNTPTRPRQESIAKAKHVLEHIFQQRSGEYPLPSEVPSSPRKLPFDTTSLRDLVTRAGVVTRALAELIRRVENSEHGTPPSDRRAHTPPNPPFSQIFQNSPTPSSSRRSPRVHRRRSSNSFLKDSPSPAGSDRNGHIQIMSVV